MLTPFTSVIVSTHNCHLCACVEKKRANNNNITNPDRDQPVVRMIENHLLCRRNWGFIYHSGKNTCPVPEYQVKVHIYFSVSQLLQAVKVLHSKDTKGNIAVGRFQIKYDKARLAAAVEQIMSRM